MTKQRKWILSNNSEVNIEKAKLIIVVILCYSSANHHQLERDIANTAMGGGICGSISQLFGVTPTLFKLDDISNCHNLILQNQMGSMGVKSYLNGLDPNVFH